MNRDAEIFAEAIELPAAERAAFLDRACSRDAVLRARVEALLTAHDHAGEFLENARVARPPALPEEKAGDVLGRYTLVRKIGEGGCGVVWLADQREPVKRPVALKIIKLGMDTRQVIARFEAERQALALMDHPDIARVFDAGATDTGRPFFVMEFVDGMPITKFCDERSLSMAARLDLFARACLALQHAHQKGIIHRDLKPSNILVALRDGVATPKIIDFGIAKATQGRLTEQTLITGFDQFIGTPTYMSPEQAELRELDLDTRSDVYSLGVLLYELLTGRPPYDPQSLVRAGVEEIRRIIREVDPPRPSTRLSTLAHADRDTIARARRSAPTQLSSALRGDLDWIVMRCLEKDRERRYGTAKELADDVRRHLLFEPVVARPPSAAYRIGKFVVRNRLACASAAAIAAALIIGTIVSTRQAIRATRAERVATQERDTAEAATRAEALARGDAQRRQEQAEALLAFMLGNFRTELKKLGQLGLLDDVGEKAMAYFASLDSRDLTDTALARQAKALTQIGDTRIDEARYAEAAAAFNNAYKSASALAARHPQDGDMVFERAQAEYWIGFLARRRGDSANARLWLTRYRDSTAALAALEGKKGRALIEFISGQHNLAVLDLDARNLDAAQKGFLAERTAREEMLAGAPGDPTIRDRLADVASWLGSVAEADGRLTEALAYFEASTKAETELVTEQPTVARWKVRQAEGFGRVATIAAVLGHREAAIAGFEQARTTMAPLLAKDPKNQQWQVSVAHFRSQQIALLLAAGDTARPMQELADQRAQLEALVALEPTSREYSGRLITTWMLEARLRDQLHRDDAAEAAARAIALSETMIKEDRADKWWVRWDFSQAHLTAGRLATAANQPAAAAQHYNQIIAALAPLATNSSDWHALDPLAQAFVLAGQPDASRPLIERLRRIGYHPVDPLARSILDATASRPTTHKN